MTVPYTFGTATTSIPLSNLDANFNTPITLGNTSIYLGNTTTTIGNLTLTNATISSGNVTLTNVSVTTANVTNITVSGTANIATGNVTTLTSTSITDSGLTSGRVTYAGASGLLSDSANLTFSGTQLGVGTASPGAAIESFVTSTSTPSLRLRYNSSSYYADHLMDSNGSYVIKSPSANGVTSGTLYLQSGSEMWFSTNGNFGASQQMRLDASGNLGLGVTPSASDSILKYVTVGNVGNSFAGFSGSVSAYVLAGTYYNGGWKYAVTGSATSRYDIGSGVHSWHIAPSGTAGNNVTFTQAMTLLSTGNLAVGVTTATERLHISNATAASNSIAQFTNGSTGTAVGNGLYVGVDTTNEATMFNFYNSAIKFGTNSAERMRIDASGNVGIGVTPSAFASGQVALQNKGGYLGAGSTSELYLSQNVFYGGSPAADRYVNTDYASSFGQTGGAFTFRTAASGTAGNAITFYEILNLGQSVVTISADEGNIAAASSIRFRTDASERARIDLDGNLLVGTTNTVIWNTTNTGVAIGGSSAPAIQISRSGDAALLLNRTSSDGDIAIFARQGSAVGGISVNTSSTSFNTSSDYRLKENIVPMTGALAKVLQLKPVTYKWKINGSDGQGFIAHELQAVVPDCVTGEKDAIDADGKPVYQQMDTSHLVATLVSAIQEQQALIESLTTRLTALENK